MQRIKIDRGWLFNRPLVRYQINGVVDTTFGNNGITLINAGYGYNLKLVSLLRQQDNKLIAVGHYTSHVDSHGTLALARFYSNGTLDSSFADNGILQLPRSDWYSAATQAILQPDGKIVIVGNENLYDVLVMRLNTDGSLDTAFANNGTYVATPCNLGYNLASSVLLQPDGSLLIAGYNETGYMDNNPFLLQLTASGSNNPAFGDNGLHLITTSNRRDIITSLLRQNDGSWLLAGYTNNSEPYDSLMINLVGCTGDNDCDGLPNNIDNDNDNDGTLNEQDAFPFVPSEQFDTDNDGQGNNADDDDDNDNVRDYLDADPLNATITHERLFSLPGDYQGGSITERQH